MRELHEHRTAKISEIITFYQKDFTEYYATLIALTEKIHEQINNEIRNAFSHLARVHMAHTEAEIDEETAKAIGHIERACRDCLKMCIITIQDNIEHQYNYALIYYKAITPLHIAEKKYIAEERKAIILAEAQGEKQLTKRLEALLERMLGLQEALEKQYGLQPQKISRLKRLAVQWCGAGVTSAIGKIIYAIFLLMAGWLAKYFNII